MSSYTKRFSFFTFLTIYLPALLWMVLIWALSDQEGLAVHGGSTLTFYLERKGAHVFEYFVLAILMGRVVRLWTKTTRDAYMWTFVWILWAATLDESHQTLVSGREGRLSDVLIDMLGAGLALGSVRLFQKMIPVKIPNKKNKRFYGEKRT